MPILRYLFSGLLEQVSCYFLAESRLNNFEDFEKLHKIKLSLQMPVRGLVNLIEQIIIFQLAAFTLVCSGCDAVVRIETKLFIVVSNNANQACSNQLD